MALAAGPQNGFGLLSYVFPRGVEEDINDVVFVPAPTQVDSLSLHFSY